MNKTVNVKGKRRRNSGYTARMGRSHKRPTFGTGWDSAGASIIASGLFFAFGWSASRPIEANVALVIGVVAMADWLIYLAKRAAWQAKHTQPN